MLIDLFSDTVATSLGLSPADTQTTAGEAAGDTIIVSRDSLRAEATGTLGARAMATGELSRRTNC